MPSPKRRWNTLPNIAESVKERRRFVALCIVCRVTRELDLGRRGTARQAAKVLYDDGWGYAFPKDGKVATIPYLCCKSCQDNGHAERVP